MREPSYAQLAGELTSAAHRLARISPRRQGSPERFGNLHTPVTTPDTSRHIAHYRPEIDGLRALAVVPVMLFHAGFSALPGGYLGVDVFFVISGYLITSILLRDLQQGRYSIAKFYERRARRILPALLLVILVSIPLACVTMLPVELEQFSRSVLSTLAFVPNVFFWLTSSYFQPSAETLPLLHTWSLGVEEQFYLLFPLFLALVWKTRPRAVSFAIVIVALVSLGLAEYAWRIGKAPAGFFLAPTRAWELMIGCLIANGSLHAPLHARLPRVAADALAITGIVALVLAMVLFDEATPMPSLLGLLPTLGTGLIIAFARPTALLTKILSLRLFVGLGLVSYSAYLWHQPILAFARLHNGSTELSTAAATALLGASLLLAWLTWKYVEAPFRERRRVATPRLWRTSAVAVSSLAAVALAGMSTRGMEFRISPENRPLAAMADTIDVNKTLPRKFEALNKDFTAGTAPRVLIVGDSYAQDFVNATFASDSAGDAQFSTVYVSADCQIYFGASSADEFIKPRFRPKCVDMRAAPALWRRLPQADIIMLIGSWRSWAVERLPQTISALHLRAEQRVFVVGPKNFGKIDIKKFLAIAPESRPALRQSPQQLTLDLNRQLLATLPRGVFVNLLEASCGTEARCPLFTRNGELISFDGFHLTPAGARWMGSLAWSRPPLAGALVARQ